MRALIFYLSFIFCVQSWGIGLLDKQLLRCDSNGSLRCVQISLKWGADIMARNKSGRTALHLATIERHFEVVKFLIEQKPTAEHIAAETVDQGTALHFATFFGDLPIAQLLLEKHPQPESMLTKQDEMGRTPLHWAVEINEFDIARFFIEKLPTAEHILAKDIQNLSVFELALTKARRHQVPLIDILNPDDSFTTDDPHNTARIIFGKSPLSVKRQLIDICHENPLVDQQLCHQLSVSLEDRISERGTY